MVLLREPVPPALRRLLRQAVVEHAAATPRKFFAPLLHVGVPGQAVTRFGVRPGEELDFDLRCEVVGAMLHRVRRRVGEPLVWLTRPGALAWHEADATWLPPTSQAFAEAAIDLTLVAVTRRGWYDPRSGLTRTWVRPRRS